MRELTFEEVTEVSGGTTSDGPSQTQVGTALVVAGVVIALAGAPPLGAIVAGVGIYLIATDSGSDTN